MDKKLELRTANPRTAKWVCVSLGGSMIFFTLVYTLYIKSTMP